MPDSFFLTDMMGLPVTAEFVEAALKRKADTVFSEILDSVKRAANEPPDEGVQDIIKKCLGLPKTPNFYSPLPKVADSGISLEEMRQAVQDILEPPAVAKHSQEREFLAKKAISDEYIGSKWKVGVALSALLPPISIFQNDVRNKVGNFCQPVYFLSLGIFDLETTSVTATIDKKTNKIFVNWSERAGKGRYETIISRQYLVVGEPVLSYERGVLTIHAPVELKPQDDEFFVGKLEQK